ncbi:MAG: peptidoglycan-binding protein, partial [Deltaproteobacteria bacterium]|nr:peptidoglycan-binding protein [Deltaproteobacteria bacterium]
MSNIETIERLMNAQNVETVLRRGSDNQEAVSALQHVLFELGYGVQLDWDRYGAEGFYGDAVANAVRIFAAQNGLATDGNAVTLEIAEKLIASHKVMNPPSGQGIRPIGGMNPPNDTAVQEEQTAPGEGERPAA